ncbi:MAG TPA: hypothetical protein VK206_07960, partial [Anaerolineales bacterium]|nr:hypothetical protein [Anaerolineales bacterium]
LLGLLREEGDDTAQASMARLLARRGDVRTDQDPCCDSMVKTDLESRERSVLLAYLETLWQHAQAAMCQHTPESYAVARLRLDTLSKFLGERPRTIFGQDDGTYQQTVTAFIPRFAPLNPRLATYLFSLPRRALLDYRL